MKRRRRTRGNQGEGVNLTPMLDVVFIMLIFFIVTASFVKEAGVDIARPDALTQRVALGAVPSPYGPGVQLPASASRVRSAPRRDADGLSAPDTRRGGSGTHE